LKKITNFHEKCPSADFGLGPLSGFGGVQNKTKKNKAKTTYERHKITQRNGKLCSSLQQILATCGGVKWYRTEQSTVAQNTKMYMPKHIYCDIY